MQNGTYIPILFLSLFMSLPCAAQPATGSYEMIPDYKDYQVSEKIILEMDRELYMAGEVIHFACFVYEPLLKRRIDISKVAYVEFYTADQIPVRQVKIQLNEGFGAGSMEIPQDLSTGRYYVRAYTNYMKNAGCEGFSYASAIVLNPFKEFNPARPENTIGKSLQKCAIYPEGGQIVYQAANHIVCAFSDELSHPVTCEARVLDHNNQLITTFTTNAYGLGSFVFTPLVDHRYRIEAMSGSSTLVENIQIPEHAATLQKIYQDGHELQFRVLKFQHSSFPLNLELYHAGNRVFLSSVGLEDSVVSIRLGPLPKGILQIRLSTERDEVLSARNIYVPPLPERELQMITNKQTYQSRETVALTLKGRPEGFMNGALSLSVFLADPLVQGLYNPEETQKALLSALYPFLVGSPYPASESMKDSLLLDQVLISKQPDVKTDTSFSLKDFAHLDYLPESKTDLIFGTLLDERDNPVASATVMQTWIDTLQHIQATGTSKEGWFLFGSDLSGVRDIVLTQGYNANGHILLQEEFYGEFLSHAKEYFSLQPGSLEKLKEQAVFLQINEAFAEPTAHVPAKDQAPFYLDPDRVFLMEDYVPMSTLEEFLFEIVPGIFPSHRRDKTVIQILNPSMGVPFGDRPLFLVDGMPVFDSDVIAQLKCSDLLSVGVLYEKCFLQDLTFDGILYIRTRKGDASVLEAPDNIYLDQFTGVQMPAARPLNDSPALNPREPCFKTQLYWDPSVEMNADGEKQIVFTAPDNAGDYLARCCVKKPDGSLVCYYAAFTVN